MIMKTILALIMGALVGHMALADGNYAKLPDYDPNAATPTYDDSDTVAQDSYGDDSNVDSYKPDNYNQGSEESYNEEPPQNYVENIPDQTYSNEDGWGQVRSACDKRESDPYRISGQLSPLRIQIICTQYSSVEARIQAKGMDTYSLKSQPVRAHRWKKDVLCEDLAHSRYDINVLCGQSQTDNASDYNDGQTYEDTEGQGS